MALLAMWAGMILTATIWPVVRWRPFQMAPMPPSAIFSSRS